MTDHRRDSFDRAAMENASLPRDVWNVTSTTEHDDDDHDDHDDDHDDEMHYHLVDIRIFALKVVYIVIGTVGVLDNVSRRP